MFKVSHSKRLAMPLQATQRRRRRRTELLKPVSNIFISFQVHLQSGCVSISWDIELQFLRFVLVTSATVRQTTWAPTTTTNGVVLSSSHPLTFYSTPVAIDNCLLDIVVASSLAANIVIEEILVPIATQTYTTRKEKKLNVNLGNDYDATRKICFKE